MLVRGNSSIRVYKPQKAVSNAVFAVCNAVMGKRWGLTRAVSREIRLIYPSLGIDNAIRIIRLVEACVPELLEGYMAEKDFSDPGLTDFEFLYEHPRDWRTDCAICLTDEITQIAVFRPCGHSVCMQPCFAEFAETQGSPLGPKIVEGRTPDGQLMRFQVGSMKDPSTCKDFACPVCRTCVTHVFQAEETRADTQIVGTITGDILQEIENGGGF